MEPEPPCRSRRKKAKHIVDVDEIEAEVVDAEDDETGEASEDGGCTDESTEVSFIMLHCTACQ